MPRYRKKNRSKKIRYSNHALSRKDFEKVLSGDSAHRKLVERAVEARERISEVEQAQKDNTYAQTTALDEEKRCSRLERWVERLTERLKQLRAERDEARSVAHAARLGANKQFRTKARELDIELARQQAELRKAIDAAQQRETSLFQKLYTENHQESLRKAGLLGGETEEETLNA